MKSSKAKCEAFASAHNLEIQIDGDGGWFGYSYWISIPNGLVLEDGTTGYTEHELELPKAEVWGMMMRDMKSLIEMKWIPADE